MPYIGKGANGFGIRERYRYSASGSQTAFTGSDLDSKTLQFDSGSLLDVYLNGVLLDTADYNTSTANTVTLTSGATASDEVMIVVYDVFSLSDAMPKTGGTFTGAVTHTGAFTSVGIDDNADANAVTIDSSERVGIANTSPLVKLDVTGSNSPPPTSGTSQTGSLRLGQTGGNGVVDMGFDTTNTQGWIQATNKANLATNYQLNLNPNGGDVYIGDGNLVVASGHGIDFAFTANTSATGASTVSELLDGYEEGSWTPVMDAASNGGTVVTTHQGGQYTKVGRDVRATFQCVLNSKGSGSGNFYVKGLPYVTGSGTTHYGFAFGYFSGTNDEQRGGWASASTSFIRFNNGANMDAQVQLSELTNGYYITGSFLYFTDS